MSNDAVPLDTGFFADPHPTYDILRDAGPARHVVLPNGWDVWMVTRYAEARAALADPRLHKDPRLLTERESTLGASLRAHMLNTDPPDHTRLRKLVNKAFTARRVESLRPRIEAITDELLDGLDARTSRTSTDEPIDLLDAFAFPLPVTVICELLGVPPDERDDFRRWSTMILSDSTGPDVRTAWRDMVAYFTRLAAAKRSDPDEDMLSALIQARDADDHLTEDELVSMAFLLLLAGHESTANLIGNGTLALLQHPDQRAMLQADTSLVPGAVEELLRYDGPVNLASLRFTTEPVVLSSSNGQDGSDTDREPDSVEIPAGAYVFVSPAAANRDPERFADPVRLDITRASGGHLAFGHGIHFCIGALLARVEGEIAFTRLLTRFPRLRLAVEPRDLRWRNSSLIRGLERLPVYLR